LQYYFVEETMRELKPEEVKSVAGGTNEHEPPGQDRREQVGNHNKNEPPGQERKE
jgi:hypothetical protein